MCSSSPPKAPSTPAPKPLRVLLSRDQYDKASAGGYLLPPRRAGGYPGIPFAAGSSGGSPAAGLNVLRGSTKVKPRSGGPNSTLSGLRSSLVLNGQRK